MYTDKTSTLFEMYDTFGIFNMPLPSVPSYISNNLKYQMRPYQEEAIGRWLHYMDIGVKTKTLPVELLFNMATGSGKTLIMAALIIDLYKRGYRNFIYFVNSTNIIEKTRDNFKNPGSKKYLFADNIMIDGQKIEIRSVENFSDSDKDAINIVFTTIQQLHMDLNNPGENKLSFSEFEDTEVVLIADEAHHNNTETLMSSEEKKDNASWESTIKGIMRTAKNPILLEFTATIDLEDANIFNKYKDHIIYRYDLKKFREDGYSKDVMIYHVDSDLKSRMLQAIIISQYRKRVALRHGIYLKPVIMFKSNKIINNKENFETFKELIKNLNTQTLKDEREKATAILKDAFDDIDVEELTNFVDELKNDFMEERLMIIDGNTITPDKQLLLNSLEDNDNEIRAIFAVDMLNEGWDVLNLFDIVRLYDTRDAKNNKPGKTTIREAQLIGRGARYFPFVIDDEDEKYIRKFDQNEEEELRLIEQLHYHSAENTKYIQEIRQALITSGIIPADYVEYTLHLKPEFKKSKTYTDGVVFVNDRQSLTNAKLHQSSLFGNEFEMPEIVEVNLPTYIGKVTSVFGENQTEEEPQVAKNNIEFKHKELIPKNITRHAMAMNKVFRFNNLEKKITAIQSADKFMDLMGKIHVVASGAGIEKNTLTPSQKLFISQEVLRNIENKIAENDETFIGTKQFEPKKISEIFKDVKRKYIINDNPDSDKEFGVPQLFAKNEKYRINLKTKEWYAYDENYGTSEEKSLVITFDSMFGELSETWDDIYLIRNEKAVTIYDFDKGRAFEPDYILLANDKKTGNQSWQIFIEPKGAQLLESDQWKEDFLQQITEKNIAKVLADNSEVKIIGLPFYNEDDSRVEFIDALKDLAKEA